MELDIDALQMLPGEEAAGDAAEGVLACNNTKDCNIVTHPCIYTNT